MKVFVSSQLRLSIRIFALNKSESRLSTENRSDTRTTARLLIRFQTGFLRWLFVHFTVKLPGYRSLAKQ